MKTTVHKTVKMAVKALCISLLLLTSITTSAQTYTTVASGNWNSASTWLSGQIPPTTVSAAQVVNIRHTVSFNVDAEIKVYGKMNITGGSLQFPVNYSKRTTVFSTGTFTIINGSFLQDVPARNGEFVTDGGRLNFNNAIVTVGKSFKSNAGSKRTYKNSSITIGEGYDLDGSSSAPAIDTILFSTLSISAAGGGHFEAKGYSQIRAGNANILVNDGDFKTDGNSIINVLPTAFDNFAFDKLKVSHNLDNAALWNARIYSYCVNGDVKGSRMAELDFTRSEDCSLASLPLSSNSGQLVMNEIYTDPGDGKNEFFELYNMSNQSEQLDNYTLVTYFHNGSEKGFYVLDFPNQVVEPKSFFAGASAFPFNYQATNNSLAANFNWNTLNNSSGGSLKKWVKSTVADATDGNLFYNVSSLPATGLNDLFNRLTGDVAYTLFLYKNGVLVNRMIAGSGGSNFVTNTVTSMPLLNIDMEGSAPDFAINFASYATMPVEVINEDAGSDNGFTREVDGGCNKWKKSSSATNHTPLESNGSVLAGGSGAINITTNIVTGTAATGSVVNFSATGSSDVFPAELQLYLDNGLVVGQFDISDELLTTKTATISGQSFSVQFYPYNLNIIIVARQSSGCIDKVKAATQGSLQTLPVSFKQLSASLFATHVALSWEVADVEEVDHFVVQRSADRQTFKDLALVFSDEAIKDYKYNDKDIISSMGTYYYKIKAVTKSGKVLYSNICVVKLNKNDLGELNVYPNPVTNNILISVPASWQNKPVAIEIFGINGASVAARNYVRSAQTQAIDIRSLPKGMYLVKATCDGQTAQQRIIKN